MTETIEYQSTIIKLVNLARPYNENIGYYKEHFINEEFNFSVKLDNGYALKISRILAQDYHVMPSILNIEDLERIANSVWKIKSE